MTLYEIDSEIYNLIDPETGEITDYEAFEGLQVERQKKLENIALYAKNLNAEAEAIKAEETRLAERRKAAEAKAERLKNYLDEALQGQRFETPRVKCTYRKTQAVEVSPDFVKWAQDHEADDLLTFKDPTPNKTKIKEAIKNGREVYGAEIVDGFSFSIK